MVKIQEVVAIMEVVEVEEIAMAGDALTTLIEEVVSEVEAGVEVVTLVM